MSKPIKSVEQLRESWSALSDSSLFQYHFEWEVRDVNQAESQLLKLVAEVEKWTAIKNEALASLNQRVLSEASKHWSAKEIKKVGL